MPKRPQMTPVSQRGFPNKIIKDLRKGKKRNNGVRIWENRIRRGIKGMQGVYEDSARNRLFHVGEQMSREACGSDSEYAHVMKMMQGGDFLQVNRILASLAAQNSSLLWKHPWHRLSVRRLVGASAEEVELTRNVSENVLNYVLQSPKNNWLTKARLAVLSAQLDMGILKAVYVPHEGDDPTPLERKYGKIVKSSTDGRDMMHFLGGQPKLTAEGNPIVHGSDGYEIEGRDPGDYWRTEWVDVQSMVFDPEGGNSLDESHAWCAQRMVWRWNRFKDNMLFQDAMKDVKRVARYLDDEDIYSPTKKAIESGLGSDSDSGSGGAGGTDGGQVNEIDADVMRVWGWQCWDFDKREVVYLVDDYEKEAQVLEYPDYMSKSLSPYSIIKIHEKPGVFEPISEVSQVRGLTRAYNFILTLNYRHIQRYTRWYLYREGMFRPNEKSRIMDKEDGRAVAYKDGFSPNEFTPVKDAPLGQDQYALAQTLRADHDMLLGSSGEQKGIAESDTATQSLLVKEGVAGRQGDKRQQIAEGFTDHSRKIHAMIQSTPEMDTSMMVQIAGPNGVMYQKMHSRAQIQGDYVHHINLEELQPPDRENDRREFRELYSIFGAPLLKVRSLTRKFMQSFSGFDPAIVEELTQFGSDMFDQMAAANEDGGNKVDGQGKTGTGSTKARSQGHIQRAGG